MKLNDGLPLPGRELDAWIAEHVMGLVPCTNECHEREDYDLPMCWADPRIPDQGSDLESYSITSAFFQVMEANRGEWRFSHVEHNEGISMRLEIGMLLEEGYWDLNDVLVVDVPWRESIEETFAHAVCCCAWRAKGGE